MSQVLSTAAPYAEEERDELLGWMLDEAQVVGQSVCLLHHCSNGCLAPFTVSSGVASKGGLPHIVGACNGAQHVLQVAGGLPEHVFGSPVSVAQGGVVDRRGFAPSSPRHPFLNSTSTTAVAGDSAAGLCGGLLASGGQAGAVLGSTQPGVAMSVGG